MVTIFEDNSPQTQRMAAISKLMGNIGQSSQNLKGTWDEAQTREALAKRYGNEFKDIKNPRIQELLAGKALDKEREEAKRASDREELEKNYPILEERFGKKNADLITSLGLGAQTAVVNQLLEQENRNQGFNDKLEGRMQDSIPKSPLKKGEVPEYKLNTARMNDKEIVEFQGTLRKENTPIWKEVIEQKKDFKSLKTDIGILEKINEKKNLPEGLEKLLIDPETGAPYPLGTILKTPHRDVQQWAKTIARQATKAQTAFPGRVTNFDLTSYMRQFPGLFNTYDGRKVILKQMDLVNEANLLISSAMEKVYAKHKLGGITPEDAFAMAHSTVEEDIKEIDQKLIDLAEEGEILSPPGEELSGKMIDVIGPDGKSYEIDEREVDQLPEGYRVK